MRNQKDPNSEQMRSAVEKLGEALRQPGDKQARILERISKETGLSFRTCRAYYYRDARRCHREHLDLLKQRLEKVHQNDIQELRERLDRLERILVQELQNDGRSAPDQDWSSLGKFGRLHCPLAG